MDNSKYYLNSRTILFNVLGAVLLVLIDHVDLLHSYLSDGGYLAVMMLAAAINCLLRGVTTNSLRFTK